MAMKCCEHPQAVHIDRPSESHSEGRSTYVVGSFRVCYDCYWTYYDDLEVVRRQWWKPWAMLRFLSRNSHLPYRHGYSEAAS